MSSEDRTHLADILESARLALSYVGDMSVEGFRSDQKTQDAVAYRIGVIGEAASSISESARAQINADWRAMIGMRHRLFHGYREVNQQIVWSTVTDDLPKLVQLLKEYLE